jgi:5-methylcytosine-specific restriction protein A
MSEGSPQLQKLNWVRDELILALDLYFRSPESHGDSNHPGVVELSELLQELPLHPLSRRLPNFRNANGVALKLANFRAFDPNYAGVGLSRGAKEDRKVWADFFGQTELLRESANAIREHYSILVPADIVDDDDGGVAEGGILLAVHRRYERDKEIVRKKKRRVFERQVALVCEVCGFDFAVTYGDHGREFAECHHTKPVSSMTPSDKTKLDDLSIVCANCHRMLHRGKDLLSIAALKKLLNDEKERRAIRQSFIAESG